MSNNIHSLRPHHIKYTRTQPYWRTYTNHPHATGRYVCFTFWSQLRPDHAFINSIELSLNPFNYWQCHQLRKLCSFIFTNDTSLVSATLMLEVGCDYTQKTFYTRHQFQNHRQRVVLVRTQRHVIPNEGFMTG